MESGSSGSTSNGSRRAGGRAARQARRRSDPGRAPAIVRRTIPVYDLLDDDALAAIEAQADWILKEIGIEFRGDDEALALFREAGCSIDGCRVRFDPGHATALAATAPGEFRMESRDPGRSIVLGGDHVVFMPGYGSPFVTDLDRGRRYATLEDFEAFVKLSFMTPWLHHGSGTVCEPVDIPVNKRHLDMVYAHLRWSTKPFMGGVTAPDRARDSIEMARIAFGADHVDEKCVIQANINVNSPLVYDGVMSSALRIYAEAGQSTAISPAIFGGAMGPVTQPAVLAQTHAEIIAGIALSQLVRPGTPVVYGNFNTTMNLKTGALTFGTPEANLSNMAFAQLGRRLGVPVRCGGQLTASNAADGLAMQESTSFMLAAILAGSNFVYHAAGWLEGGLTMSYEKFVMDLDHCGMMLRMIAGLEVNEAAFAKDAYEEAGPGQAFFGTQHTLANFETANYVSELLDAGPYETWMENGAPDAAQRANGRWKQMLADYEAPAIDPAVDEELRDFMTRRKAAMPDQWY
ncbi:MAG: trimethylamine methyltransferase family protein [Rhodospirillales bacterium]|nr:trimethylamine methyltransferase family protein [Rhodospirillales bacterium]